MSDPASYKVEPLRVPGLSQQDYYIYLAFKNVTDDFEFNHKNVRKTDDWLAYYWIFETDSISRRSVQDYFLKYLQEHWTLEGSPKSSERDWSLGVLKSKALQVFRDSIVRLLSKSDRLRQGLWSYDSDHINGFATLVQDLKAHRKGLRNSTRCPVEVVRVKAMRVRPGVIRDGEVFRWTLLDLEYGGRSG